MTVLITFYTAQTDTDGYESVGHPIGAEFVAHDGVVTKIDPATYTPGIARYFSVRVVQGAAEAEVAALRAALRETDELLDEWYELAHLSGGGRDGTLVARSLSRLQTNDAALAGANGDNSTLRANGDSQRKSSDAVLTHDGGSISIDSTTVVLAREEQT